MKLDLKPIRLNGTCEHSSINTKSRYLVKIEGEWFIGKFSKQWYGWNFDNWGASGIQLDSISKVYEVGRLP